MLNNGPQFEIEIPTELAADFGVTVVAGNIERIAIKASRSLDLVDRCADPERAERLAILAGW